MEYNEAQNTREKLRLKETLSGSEKETPSYALKMLMVAQNTIILLNCKLKNQHYEF